MTLKELKELHRLAKKYARWFAREYSSGGWAGWRDDTFSYADQIKDEIAMKKAGERR